MPRKRTTPPKSGQSLSLAQPLITHALQAQSAGKHELAISMLTEAASLEPKNASIPNELGVIYFHLGRLDQAIEAFNLAVRLNPGFALALTNLGAAYNERGDKKNSVAYHEQAVVIDPKLAIAWKNAGKAWNDLGEHERAVYCAHRALDLQPNSADTAYGLAIAYRRSGRYDRCLQYSQRAIQLNPQFANAHYELALACFHLEDYPNAVKAFEWRMQKKEMLKHKQELWPIFDRPAYAGEDLSDRTLLLHTEQGFGDNLQFARFISLVRPRVKRLVMWCRPGLGDLFANSFDLDDVSENVFQLPEFDCHLPVLSIAHHFDPRLEQLEKFAPYLLAKTLPNDIPLPDATGKLKIGLVWGASDSGFDHANKKLPLEALRGLFSIPGTSWHSLQVGSDRNELLSSDLGATLHDLGGSFRNFTHTANAVSQMDLVISCDTSVAHLAGGMGKPVWIMLKKDPDWRWHSDGETTIWYPSARLYRQYSHGNWSHVVSRIQRDLERLIAQG